MRDLAGITVIDGILIPDEQGMPAAYRDEKPVRDKYWRPGPGDVVLDIGAAVGSYTLPALLNGARVIAVDPDAEATRKLARVASLNEVSGYQVCSAALWSSAEGYPPDMRESLESADYPGCLIPPAAVTWLTLDQVTAVYELDRLDWIKMDVEGAELGVLRGGTGTLTRFHPRLLIEDHTEVYPFVADMGSRRLCRELLERLNYQVEEFSWGPPSRTYLVAS